MTFLVFVGVAVACFMLYRVLQVVRDIAGRIVFPRGDNLTRGDYSPIVEPESVKVDAHESADAESVLSSVSDSDMQRIVAMVAAAQGVK